MSVQLQELFDRSVTDSNGVLKWAKDTASFLRSSKTMLLQYQLQLQSRLNDMAVKYLTVSIARHCPPVTILEKWPMVMPTYRDTSPVTHLWDHYCNLLESLDVVIQQLESPPVVSDHTVESKANSIREKPSKRRRHQMNAVEINQGVSDWLVQNAGKNRSAISAQMIAEALGVSKSSVLGTPSWKVFHRRRREECPPRKREVSLTERMTATIPHRETKTPDDLVAEEEELELLMKQQADDMRRDSRTPRRAKLS